MMFCVRKNLKRCPILAPGLAAASLVALLSHFEPAAADDRQAPPKWDANVETEAEFAYRSVYERSLAVKNAAQAPPPKARQAQLTASAPDGIPDLPTRKTDPKQPNPVQTEAKDAAPVEAERTPPQAPEATVSPSIFGEPPADSSLAYSLIGRPRSLADVITTQVLGDENGPAEARPGLAPRGRGDQYCTNIASAAADARFAWQQQLLLETEEQVKNRIADLEAKIAEYRKWLARRDDFSRKAQSVVTDIYGKMRPDAAAQQLMALNEEMAAAVITKLNPRVASAVMAEMDAGQAARLSAIISGAAKGPKGKAPAQQQDKGT